MILIKTLAVLLLATAAYSQFDGYQLLRIEPQTEKQIELVGQWLHNTDFDVWSKKTKHIDVALSPDALRKYLPTLNRNGVQYKVINKNIQETFEEEQRSIFLQKMQLKATGQEGKIVNTFAHYNDIISWLEMQEAANPAFLSTFSVGRTFENRDLKVIKFTSTNANARNIWIDCGIHAREWISPATCIYIIDSLIRERYNQAQSVLDKYNIYVLPVHNPDGYAFSMSSPANRMWRKNRKINSGSTCVGVDLNRNFGYKWFTGGSSNNPCSETFAGPFADSELETRAVEGLINSKRGTWDAFITIHTYGEYWFTPWGYTDELPNDYTELVAKSNIATAAIKAVHGQVFQVGSSTALLYVASGGSDDWAKGDAGIKYSHCLELRPGNTGEDSNYAFQLPVDRAPKAGEETYRGIIAFLNAI